MALDTAVLFLIAPQFTTDSRAATFLALAEQCHTATAWGEVYTQAMSYFAAHMLTTAPATGGSDAAPGGPVTSKKAGDVAVSYGSPGGAPMTSGDADLMTTAYGRRYLQLRESRAAVAPRVVFL